MNRYSCGDELVCEALWNSAGIRLFTVFDGPNGSNLDILDDLPDGAREAYQFFNNYRNKHIAHRVNPIDQIKAGVILSDHNSDKRQVLAVANLSMKDVSFADTAFVDSFEKFARALQRQIESEIKLWSDRTLHEAKGRHIDDLYNLPPLRVVVPSKGHCIKVGPNKTHQPLLKSSVHEARGVNPGLPGRPRIGR
jgi:hypothetical protein